jgi:hypothetical protein
MPCFTYIGLALKTLLFGIEIILQGAQHVDLRAIIARQGRCVKQG